MKRSLRITLSICLSAMLSLPALAFQPQADRVLVVKGERRIYLYQGEELLRSYKIALGKNPLGHKQRRGDNRTPEGRYTLDRRIVDSKFYRAIHISYPNEQDAQRAAAKGVHPGGNIMIHGVPNRYSDGKDFFVRHDWTEGCIAVTNEDMFEIWQLVAENTPIEIRP
ncbi:L,D-transpeptidase family protein [Trichloromonas sp.]|uniref:L,D-transpeptidase family protein n=1 Tax=Trichloromonas sp. TaxID=3069249 RepID=UPI002A44694A|nr:L,D-transpeptidase family protein [Trichloromonas sp.]